MNIAVLVCGHYREFDYAVKSWENLLGFDFYFSTWDLSVQNTEKWTYDCIDFPVDESMITKYIPHAKVEIMDSNQLGGMITHWKNTLKMCRESGIKYDKLIVIRPDLYIKLNDESVMNQYNDNDVLYCRGNGDDWFEDMFFMGTFDSVSKFIDKLEINSAVADPHRKLSVIIKSLGMTHRPMHGDLDLVILRPNIKLIKKEKVDIYKAKVFESYFIEVYNRNKD